MLHLNCTALSQSELSQFFIFIVMRVMLQSECKYLLLKDFDVRTVTELRTELSPSLFLLLDATITVSKNCHGESIVFIFVALIVTKTTIWPAKIFLFYFKNGMVKLSSWGPDTEF